MTQKCIQHVMEENLSLLKDLSEFKEWTLQIHDFNIKNVLIDKLDDIVNNVTVQS